EGEFAAPEDGGPEGRVQGQLRRRFIADGPDITAPWLGRQRAPRATVLTPRLGARQQLDPRHRNSRPRWDDGFTLAGRSLGLVILPVAEPVVRRWFGRSG